MGGAFLFFEKAGEIKNSALKDIENIQEDIREIHKKDNEQDKKIDENVIVAIIFMLCILTIKVRL